MLDDESPPNAPSASASADPRVGTLLAGKWRVDSLLGTGGMATVYAATHRNGSRAAVKVLLPEFAAQPEVRQRFLREGRIANKVDHLARVAVLDDDEGEHGDPFLVMELLEGETLGEMLKSAGGRLPAATVLHIFDVVLDLLAECHKVGIVHRDIKPGNIFVTRKGEVKVLDFGVARLREWRQGEEVTRAGTAMGTPGFMAPEQAMGLTEQIDGRADLFSVGACVYIALSGVKLRRARNEAESLVLAATRPVPSIANVAPELPVQLVAWVDKALTFDRTQRYQDAVSMRMGLTEILVGLRTGRLSEAVPGKAAGVVARASDVIDVSEEPDDPEHAVRAVSILQGVWKNVGLCMGAARQYGWDHPTTARATQAAFEQILAAHTFHPQVLWWDVAPYGFLRSGAAVWEPERPPLDRVPYQLFADGFRKMQIHPGITGDELRDFIALLSHDRTEGTGEEDAVSSFWDRRFEHIAYFAVESFAEGEADAREAFEKECDKVAAFTVTMAQIDAAWETGSTESLALERNLDAMLGEVREAAASLALDPVTRGSLGARMQQGSEQTHVRFLDAFAHGWEDASGHGDLPLLEGVLREWTRDQITLHNHRAAFEMFDQVCDAMARRSAPAAEATRARLAGVMFDVPTVSTILATLTGDGHKQQGPSAAPVDPGIVKGLATVLEHVDDPSLLDAVLDCYDACRDTELRATLLRYVRRRALGREAQLGTKLETCGLDLSLELLLLLSNLQTPQALTALDATFRSRHVAVRIQALVHVPEAVAAKHATLLEDMLQDPEVEVRRETLQVVGRLGLQKVVPALVKRVSAPSFHDIPIPERRLWLTTLWDLDPSRGEAAVIEIVGGSKLIPSDSLEQTRAVAADLLSRSSSPAAMAAARNASKKRWWNSPPVREAAERAIAAIERRTQASDPSAGGSP